MNQGIVASRRETPADGDPTPDGARRLLVQRARERGLTLADLSRQLQRNESYLHQFVHRGTPRRLPEDTRATLAALLDVPEDSLRGQSRIVAAAQPVLPAPGPTSGRADAVATPPSVLAERDVPVYADDGVIIPSEAIEWTWRPPRLLTGRGAFAIWISRARGRLQAGDLAYVRIGQPPRVGDTVVAAKNNRLIAIGDLVGLDERRALIRETGEEPVSLERDAVRLLKVVYAEFA